ncbi:MAG: CsgG/HfaB family protein [Archangium sp.]
MLALSLATALICAAGAEEPPVVSVLYFDNNSNDPELEFMRKGFTDLLITDLVAWDGVKVVERTRLEDVMKELKFQQTKYVDKASAAKLGKILSATYLIYGSILPGGTQVNVEARLVRASDGVVIFTVREVDERNKIFDLEQRLANQIVAKIDSKLSANAQARRMAKVPDLDALIAYSKFLDLSDQGKLEEAQAAVRALVSKAPTFLLARNRQTELLKALEEYQKRKKDMLNSAVIELGKRVDAALKDEAKYDTMSLDEKQHFLMMRVLKGRFLARVLKQYVSTHGHYLRLVNEKDEPKALIAMRNWVENHRRLMAETERGARQHAQVYGGVSTPARMDNGKLTQEEEDLIRDGVIGEKPNWTEMTFQPMAEFVLLGQISDGDRYRIGPVLAALDPKEDKAVRDELDARVKAGLARYTGGDRGAEHDVGRLLEFKAEVALQALDIDGAVVAYQQILDAFPTGSRADWVEKRIKDLLEGRGNEFSRDQQWAKAIVDCSDDLNGGSLSFDRRLYRTGIRGLDQILAEIKKCKPEKSSRLGLTYALKHLAELAAQQDDCTRAAAYWKDFYEYAGGQASEIETSRKAWSPWCDFSGIQKGLTWFHLDGDLQGDFPRRPVSIMSYDDKVITISANTDGPRYPSLGGQEESFDLRLEKQKDGTFKCVQARYRYHDGKYYEGTCEVKMKNLTLVNGGPGSDEGTCQVEFPKFPIGDFFQKQKAHCDFRVRRE